MSTRNSINLNMLSKEANKVFPKSGKYISLVLGLILLAISIFMYFQQMKVGKYVKENFGEAVYNILSDNKILEKTSIKEKDNKQYLWYIAEDSGELEIVKEGEKYFVNILSNVTNDKIQIYPPIEIEKQNPNRLYKVTKVVDGDTIKIDFDGTQLTIRMIGIDTPESVHSDSNKNIPEGKIASDYTKDRLEGKEVKLEFDVQPRDKYNRLLAYVYIDGSQFNKELLEKGYARLSTYPPNVRYVDEYTSVQKKAISSKKGFWSKKIWNEGE